MNNNGSGTRDRRGTDPNTRRDLVEALEAQSKRLARLERRVDELTDDVRGVKVTAGKAKAIATASDTQAKEAKSMAQRAVWKANTAGERVQGVTNLAHALRDRVQELSAGVDGLQRREAGRRVVDDTDDPAPKATPSRTDPWDRPLTTYQTFRALEGRRYYRVNTTRVRDDGGRQWSIHVGTWEVPKGTNGREQWEESTRAAALLDAALEYWPEVTPEAIRAACVTCLERDEDDPAPYLEPFVGGGS